MARLRKGREDLARIFVPFAFSVALRPLFLLSRPSSAPFSSSGLVGKVRLNLLNL